MRTALSLLVIVFSAFALGSGYLGGLASPARAESLLRARQAIESRMPAPQTFTRTLHGAHSLPDSDDSLSELEEDAVIDAGSAAGRLGDDATLALVIVHAGRSVRLESGFWDLPVPMTIAIDAGAEEASSVAIAAHDRGKIVYAEFPISAGESPSAMQRALARVSAAVPHMSGVAVRFDDGAQRAEAASLAAALRGSKLRVLDLGGIGTFARSALASAGSIVRTRDVTIDGRSEPAYVAFMLSQAVQVARGRGAAVIVAHPLPASLGAIATLVSNSSRDGVNFTPL